MCGRGPEISEVASKFKKNTDNSKSIIEALKSRFYKKIDNNTFLQQFTTAFQGPGESNRAFLARVQGLSFKCFGNNDVLREKFLVQRCIQGLQPRVRQFILPQGPKTFQNIWDLALQEEQFQEFEFSQTPVNFVNLEKTGQSSELTEIKNMLQIVTSENDKKMEDLTNQVKTLTLLVNQQNSRQTPNYSHNGQTSYQGRDNFQRNRRENIVCFKCGLQGHIKKFCRVQQPVQSSQNTNTSTTNNATQNTLN